MPRLTRQEAWDLAYRATIRAGANEATARSLADATVAAELAQRPAVGFAHLKDYLAAFACGRIAATVVPEVDYPAPALIHVDAKGAIGQLGFDMAFDELVSRASTYGIAILAQRGSYTTGELGYYARRLALKELVAIAATNGPALMTPGAGTPLVYCTNPLAFAAPVEGGLPLVIDQASSATAFVNIRQAAEQGLPIPDGWAVDAEGQPTTDAREAMKGALLAFGGSRGANIALMVEVLAAGLTGANWSLDAPSFAEGDRSPGIGLFVVALKPDLLTWDFAARLALQLDRLAANGVHIPGRSAASDGTIELPAALVATLEAYLKSALPLLR
ncbi:malate dehydrogenase [Labrys miyagiensis]|uniref:Malate dehydrogenase n=1 Tax=Labrys miyagiensis TaxID=346912 RepID=A0ABQ6CFQ8_9HYPH|nr:Ldh family oxidoreductase [Labrys miyagiensis]GLS18995.1 malate dehydrogenase [Labrys miyagiensis]